MPSGPGTELYRPARRRGEFAVDLMWSAALVAGAFVATRWLEPIGIAPALAVYLTAVVVAGAVRGVRSGLATALSGVAICAVRWAPRTDELGIAPAAIPILLAGFLALALATGFVTGQLTDEVRRLAARRSALLSLARSYATVVTPTGRAGAGPGLVQWVYRVVGTDACYLDGAKVRCETEEAALLWPPAGLLTLAVAAQTRPGRTLQSGRLRARALSDHGEVVGVLAWRSPKVSRDDARHIDLVVGDVADLVSAAWHSAMGAEAAH